MGRPIQKVFMVQILNGLQIIHICRENKEKLKAEIGRLHKSAYLFLCNFTIDK